jgi:hypothetical protein
MAKRAGMDFVTLTDHETIEGALALAHRPDFFVGEEVSAYLPEEDGYVDVLVYGLDEEAHGEAQASGLPAVISGIGGPRERIRPGCLWLRRRPRRVLLQGRAPPRRRRNQDDHGAGGPGVRRRDELGGGPRRHDRAPRAARRVEARARRLREILRRRATSLGEQPHAAAEIAEPLRLR